MESKNDVQYYKCLYDCFVGPSLLDSQRFVYEPVFLEPHNRVGSSCSDVTDIVAKLRGNDDYAYDINDYDLENHSDDAVFVLGDGNRYAIENYLLDPLLVALALIRCYRGSFAEFGVCRLHTYLDASKLLAHECQAIIGCILGRVGIDMEDLLDCTLVNGYVVQYPKGYLRMNGHDYESLLKEKFAGLGALIRGQAAGVPASGVIPPAAPSRRSRGGALTSSSGSYGRSCKGWAGSFPWFENHLNQTNHAQSSFCRS